MKSTSSWLHCYDWTGTDKGTIWSKHQLNCVLWYWQRLSTISQSLYETNHFKQAKLYTELKWTNKAVFEQNRSLNLSLISGASLAPNHQLLDSNIVYQQNEAAVDHLPAWSVWLLLILWDTACCFDTGTSVTGCKAPFSVAWICSGWVVELRIYVPPDTK